MVFFKGASLRPGISVLDFVASNCVQSPENQGRKMAHLILREKTKPWVEINVPNSRLSNLRAGPKTDSALRGGDTRMGCLFICMLILTRWQPSCIIPSGTMECLPVPTVFQVCIELQLGSGLVTVNQRHDFPALSRWLAREEDTPKYDTYDST